MRATDLERLAETIYEQAGLDPVHPVVPVHLAAELFGSRNVLEVGDLDDVAVIHHGRLLLRRGDSDAAHDWHTARAISRWALECLRHDACSGALDALGAALRAPRRAFAPVAERTGQAFADLGEAFAISAHAAALRYGEVTGVRVVLSSPGGVIKIRGSRRLSARPRTLRLGLGRVARVFAAA